MLDALKKKKKNTDVPRANRDDERKVARKERRRNEYTQKNKGENATEPLASPITIIACPVNSERSSAVFFKCT